MVAVIRATAGCDSIVSLSYAAVTCPSEAARAAEKSEQDLADRSDETKSENAVAKKTVTDEKDDGEGTAGSKEGTNADVGAKGEGKAKVSDSGEGICAENGVSRDGDAEGVGGDGEKAAGGEDSEGKYADRRCTGIYVCLAGRTSAQSMLLCARTRSRRVLARRVRVDLTVC